MNPLSELNRLPLLVPAPRRPPPRRRRRRTTREARSPERRASARVQVQLELEERYPGGRCFRLTHDLSTFGLSTRLGSLHPLGTRLTLALGLPDGDQDPVHLSGEVVGVQQETGGLRIAFRNPSVRALRRIHRFLLTFGQDATSSA